jgi:hypothetical protein
LIDAIPRGDLEDIRRSILEKRMAAALKEIREEEKLKDEE